MEFREKEARLNKWPLAIPSSPVMKEEYCEWFRSKWEDFWEEYDCAPSADEWLGIVWLDLDEGRNPPFAREERSRIIELIDQAFVEMQIPDLFREEIRRKARDADANLHNRKYVDGTF